jgi:septum formation protein
MTMKFILASQSPRRKELLALANIPFEVIPSDAEEVLNPDLTPEQQVKALALLKATDLSGQYPERYIIGADTIVVLDNQILGKPVDEADAIQMLKSLRGKQHQVMTAVAIVNMEKKIKKVFINITDVTFYDLSDQWIADYVASGLPLDKAGSYGIQDAGFELVEKINGDYYSVMGLPIAQLKRVITELNIEKR